MPALCPGIDQRADVRVARRNDAREWRHDPLLERLQVAKVRQHVCGGRIGSGFLGGRIARLFFRVLLGNRFGRQQSLPARIGAVGESLVGAGCRKIGQRLGQLLIDLRVFDHGEDLALGDLGADVRVPYLEVAVGARVNRRFDECLNRAGQYQLFAQGAGLGFHRDYGGYRRFGGILAECRAREHPAYLAPDAENNGHDERKQRRSGGFFYQTFAFSAG